MLGPLQRSSLLLHRLQTDIDELLKVPLPSGVNVFTDGNNIKHLCIGIKPLPGGIRGVALHVEVRIPPNWPGEPPEMFGGTWTSFIVQAKPDLFFVQRHSDSRNLLRPRNYLPSNTLHDIVMDLYKLCSGIGDGGAGPISLLRRRANILSLSHRRLLCQAEQEANDSRCTTCGFGEADPFKGGLVTPFSPRRDAQWMSSPGDYRSTLRFADLPVELILQVCEHLPNDAILALCESSSLIHGAIFASSTIVQRRLIQCHYLRLPILQHLSTPSFHPPSARKSRMRASHVKASSPKEVDHVPSLTPHTSFGTGPPPAEGRRPSRIVRMHKPILGISLSWDYSPITNAHSPFSGFSITSATAVEEFGVTQDASGNGIDVWLALPFKLALEPSGTKYDTKVQRKVWRTWNIAASRMRGRRELLFEGPSGEMPCSGCRMEAVLDLTVRLMSTTASTFFDTFLTRGVSPRPSGWDESVVLSKLIQNYWRLHALLIFWTHRVPGFTDAIRGRLEMAVCDRDQSPPQQLLGIKSFELLVCIAIFGHLDIMKHGQSDLPQHWQSRLLQYTLEEFSFTHTGHLLEHEPSLEVDDEATSTSASVDFRLSRTFSRLRRHIAIFMFQVQFMQVVTNSSAGDMQGPGPGYGFVDFAPVSVTHRMRKAVLDILATRTWIDFVNIVSWDRKPALDKNALVFLLRDTTASFTSMGPTQVPQFLTQIRRRSLQRQRWWAELFWRLELQMYSCGWPFCLLARHESLLGQWDGDPRSHDTTTTPFLLFLVLLTISFSVFFGL